MLKLVVHKQSNHSAL